MNGIRAVYAGSFDPFTKGHLSIVEQSARLFDEVIVGIAVNPDKKRTTDCFVMKNAMEKQLSHLENVIVVIIDNLVADYCANVGVGYLIRGLRNTSDYLYEENIAKVNREINPNLKTIYFRAENDAISSTMVKTLIKYGKDISKFVPEEIRKIL